MISFELSTCTSIRGHQYKLFKQHSVSRIMANILVNVLCLLMFGILSQKMLLIILVIHKATVGASISLVCLVQCFFTCLLSCCVFS